MGAAPSLPSQPHSVLGGLGEGDERLHASLGPTANTPSQQQFYESVGLDGQRITVDIRGADLDDENGYQVWVRRQSGGGGDKVRARLQQQASLANGVMQGILGLGISLLTVIKLYEEIRFIRSLRGELSFLAGSLPGLGSGPGLPGAFGGSSGPPDASAARGGAAQGRQGQGVARAAAASGKDSLVDELNNTPLPGLGGGAEGRGVAGQPGWEAISGLDEVKQLLQEVTVLPSLRPDLFKGIRQPPRGVLLFGPPGSGKTLLARVVANESQASFFAITGSSVLSMWYGQSEANVRALFEKARQQQPSVIFIDEVDSLLGKRGGNPGAPGGGGGGSDGTTPDRRVTNEFLAFIDGIQTEAGDARIIVMAATNHPWDLDEAALSRFSRRIYVPLPDRAARAQLLSSTMRGTPCSVTPAGWLQVADKCAKYSGRDLVVLCREASMRPLRALWGPRLLSCGPEPVSRCGQAVSSAGCDESADDSGAVAAAEHTARARVVSLLAGHLHAGRSAKRLRKELSQWRRQQGEAVGSWCDVDAIMREAGQRARAIPQLTGQQRSQASSEQLHAQGGGASVGEPASRCGSQADERPSAGGGGAGMAGGEVGGESSGTSRAEARGATNGGAAAVVNGPAAACSALASVGPSTSGAQQACGDSAPLHGSSSPQGTGEPDPLSSQQAAQVPLAAQGHTPPPCVDLSTGATTADPPTTSLKPNKPSSDTSAAKASTTSPAGAPAALTLSQLLALPASEVREVTQADFEAALNNIRPSELELTAAYDEFNDKYGSGVTQRRTAAHSHSYMHIYI